MQTSPDAIRFRLSYYGYEDRSSSTYQLTQHVTQLKVRLKNSSFEPYQIETLNSNLIALSSLIQSIEYYYPHRQIPKDVYINLQSLILKYERLVAPPTTADNTRIIDSSTPAVRRQSIVFESPLKDKLGRNSLSEATITRENVTRDSWVSPAASAHPSTSFQTAASAQKTWAQDVNFHRFTNPGIQAQLPYNINDALKKAISPTRETRRSSTSSFEDTRTSNVFLD